MSEHNYVIKGFKASAVAAGLKKDKGPDMGLIYCEKGAAAAGVFTTNKVKAAPVILSEEHIRCGRVKAVVANSGNANACTGKAGLEHARETADLVAKELGISREEVLVASTGVIGAPLNMDRIARAVPRLAEGLSEGGIPQVVKAIMTTDSFPKIARFEGEARGRHFQIVGIAKGAGMIMPRMATMLSFVLSDIRIDVPELKRAVRSSVETSFNRITVDGDTSTNDTVLVLASGTAGNDPLSPDDFELFREGLAQVMGQLAAMIVRDGEGATRVIHVKVKGAATAEDAETAARTIANSMLVKTACYGRDANWGRIMAALGRSPIQMREDRVSIWVDEVMIVENGLGVGAEAERQASERMDNREFSLTIDLLQGAHEDRVLTCDLTHEYVSINANYRT